MPALVRPVRLPVRALMPWSVAALALVTLGAVTLLAGHTAPWFQQYDDGWDGWVRGSRTPWLTGANLVLNFVGQTGMIVYCAGLFVALLFRHHRLAFFTAGANLAVLAATHLLKALTARPRPAGRLVTVDSGSFPSGHTTVTVAAAVTTAVVLGRLWVWISGAILSVAMMYSRTYLGAHWLWDTIAGALLGAGLVFLLWAAVQDKCLQPYIPVNAS
ncbi:phosphatase PAP2 family protein [Specibacter cremeus]|uniref:phosphatase PAP2 family protein n=1 Tax=Specibacter cremeus TaxID=1629051 RepID=UPI000F7834C7|nr:phosphatase PAP2 family protein [Specibacter cremeus]